jgi:hypothetical protein
MAFGIDDILSTAAAGISLTNTVSETVSAYRKKGKDVDIEQLIEEVRVTAIERINEADQALAQFERTLVDRDVDLSRPLQDVIESTSFWRPFEQHRLKRYKRSFDALADATYNANDDVAALLRCKDQTGAMGIAVAESAKEKHAFHSALLHSRSVGEAIGILREELLRHKNNLM